MGRLPLYKEFVLPELTRCNNRGLLFDRFCDEWGANWALGERKRQWLNSVARVPAGESALLEEAVLRTQMLVEELGGRVVFMRTASRFITGTGNEHPVENGFTWHPILSAPYLPGSSVKGLLRSMLVQEKSDLVDKICGSPGTGAGSLIFFDALPLKPVQLAVDVMTPHYSDYYQGDAPPGDWQLPKPIPFLTVDRDQLFMFAFTPTVASSSSGQLLDYVEARLIEALDWGAGAKTAVGYGRFVLDETEKEKFLASKEAIFTEKRQQQELANLSPLQRDLLNDGIKSDDFISKIDLWADKAAQAKTEDRLEIASALKEWYEQFRPGFYENPNKKNKERVERIKTLFRDPN